MLNARLAAAAKYTPRKVRLLIVAEAPPCATDRYFYFEEVASNDWLFRYVFEGLYGAKPERETKADDLARLRDDGIFLIDLHEDNVSQPDAKTLGACIPGLIDRCRALKPEHIVLIKSIVHDVAFAPLKAAGMPVIDKRLPFPASGQQRNFRVGFREALAAAGFSPRSDSGSAVPAPEQRGSGSAGARPRASASRPPRR
jgi:hypothetical protein